MLERFKIRIRNMKQKTVQDCNEAEGCKCSDKDKPANCGMCQWYTMLDSGYGYCRTFPTFIIVPWCRDVCSQFSFRRIEPEIY